MLNKFLTCVAACLGMLIISISGAYALPIAYLDGPSPPVYTGTNFDIRVLVDVVPSTDQDPSDTLLAFGFNTNAPASWTWVSTVVAAPFSDDSGFYGGNPEVAGSAFPGVTGNDILLATLTYNTNTAGLYAYSIAGTTSMTINHRLFFELSFSEIDASTDVDILNKIVINEEGNHTSVPEPAAIILLGLGFLALSVMGHQFGKNKRRAGEGL